MCDATVLQQDVTTVTQKQDLIASGDKYTLHSVVRVTDALGWPLCLVVFGFVRYMIPLIIGYVLWGVA